MNAETVIGKMRGRGYKTTPQRVAVVEALAAEQHQSLEEVHSRCPQVGLVTIYRTLDMLSEIGAVRRLDLGDGSRYELAEDHHHHLICESCGSISEFEACPLDPSKLDVGADFQITSHSLEVYGNCGRCQ